MSLKFGQEVICVRAPWHSTLFRYIPHGMTHGGFGPRVNEVVTIGETHVHPDRRMVEILEYRHCECGRIVCFRMECFEPLVESEVIERELNQIFEI